MMLPALAPSRLRTRARACQAIRSNLYGFIGAGGVAYVRASPPDGPSQTIVRVPAERLPGRSFSLVMSPDGRHMATLLSDGATTNIWLLPTGGGPMAPVTDFGDRFVTMTRSISWSRDSQHIYAAVAENRTDVVLLDGLL